MGSLAKTTSATIIPCLRYRNAPAASETFAPVNGRFLKLALQHDKV